MHVIAGFYRVDQTARQASHGRHSLSALAVAKRTPGRAEKPSDHRASSAAGDAGAREVEWAYKPSCRSRGWRNGGGLVEDFGGGLRVLRDYALITRADDGAS